MARYDGLKHEEPSERRLNAKKKTFATAAQRKKKKSFFTQQFPTKF